MLSGSRKPAGDQCSASSLITKLISLHVSGDGRAQPPMRLCLPTRLHLQMASSFSMKLQIHLLLFAKSMAQLVATTQAPLRLEPIPFRARPLDFLVQNFEPFTTSTYEAMLANAPPSLNGFFLLHETPVAAALIDSSAFIRHEHSTASSNNTSTTTKFPSSNHIRS